MFINFWYKLEMLEQTFRTTDCLFEICPEIPQKLQTSQYLDTKPLMYIFAIGRLQTKHQKNSKAKMNLLIDCLDHYRYVAFISTVVLLFPYQAVLFAPLFLISAYLVYCQAVCFHGLLKISVILLQRNPLMASVMNQIFGWHLSS